VGWDYRYSQRFFWLRRGYNHIGRLIFAPWGALKFFVMMLVVLGSIVIVVTVLGILLAGHISHV